MSRGLSASTLNRRIEVFQGVVLTVEEYLRTRLVEMVVHFDDLAVSAGAGNELELPQDTPTKKSQLSWCKWPFADTADLSVVRGLARRERHPDAIRAL